MDAKALGSVVAVIMKRHEFKRKTTSWYRQFPEVTQVVNLQRSPWSPQYYINVGVALRALLDEPTPKENHCHLRIRVEAVGLDAAMVKDAFNLKLPTFDEERAELIRGILDPCVAWLNRFRSEAEIKAALVAEPSLLNYTIVVGRRHLGFD